MTDLAAVLRMRDQLARELVDIKRRSFALQYKLEGINETIKLLGGDPISHDAVALEAAVPPGVSLNGKRHVKAKLARGTLKPIILGLIKGAGEDGVSVGDMVTRIKADGTAVLPTSVRAFCYKQRSDGALICGHDGRWRMKA